MLPPHRTGSQLLDLAAQAAQLVDAQSKHAVELQTSAAAHEAECVLVLQAAAGQLAAAHIQHHAAATIQRHHREARRRRGMRLVRSASVRGPRFQFGTPAAVTTR